MLQDFHCNSDGKSGPDLLRVASALHRDLANLSQGEHVRVAKADIDIGAADMSGAVAKALERFARCLNEEGLAWIQSLIQEMGDLTKVESTVRECLQKPTTAFLEGCLATCGMARQLEDDTTFALGSSLAEVAAATPVYAKLSSINLEVMKLISPNVVAKCKDFCQKMAAQLSQYAEAFQTTVNQLAELAKKYLCLAIAEQ